MIRIEEAQREVVRGLISAHNSFSVENMIKMEKALELTTDLWVGWANDRPVCAWGLISPSLLSDKAYLWMVSLEPNRYALARHSRSVIAAMLARYPTIVGHCEEYSIRWLRWLGATFGPADEVGLPFTIRRA